MKHREELEIGLLKSSPKGLTSTNEVSDDEDNSEDQQSDDELEKLFNSTLNDFDVVGESSEPNTELEILNLLYAEICDLLKATGKFQDIKQNGHIKAHLVMLRENWNVFKNKYYELRAARNNISLLVNMQVLQNMNTCNRER